MLNFTNTKDTHLRGLKFVVYGESGVGKTSLAKTLLKDHKPVIVSAEGGTLSLADVSIPVIEVASMTDAIEAREYLAAENDFDWVIVDSLTEVLEVTLNDLKKETKDPRKAYGEVAERGAELVRSFRDLPKNVLMTALLAKSQDEKSGRTYYQPSFPGSQLAVKVPALFDEVFALRIFDGDNGPERRLQTGRSESFTAKDRSGTLELFEPADLAHVARKITKKGKGK